MTEAMLAELSEAAATGRIAEIYDEIRRFSGVPYVSSLQRYLATLPGVLPWAWNALRPALASGVIPETGWRLAAAVRLSPPGRLSMAQLTAWGLDAAQVAAIRNVAANFVRVSPVNLVMGACLSRLLTGTVPAGAGYPDGWVPPALLPPMPGNVDPAGMSAADRAVLMRFATVVDGKPFVPALYRQIAHWPRVLGWLAEELTPRLGDPQTARTRAAVRGAAREAAVQIVAGLAELPQGRAPDAATAQRVLATIDRYAETSPEMTMFGRLILEALPEGV